MHVKKKLKKRNNLQTRKLRKTTPHPLKVSQPHVACVTCPRTFGGTISVATSPRNISFLSLDCVKGSNIMTFPQDLPILVTIFWSLAAGLPEDGWISILREGDPVSIMLTEMRMTEPKRDSFSFLVLQVTGVHSPGQTASPHGQGPVF